MTVSDRDEQTSVEQRYHQEADLYESAVEPVYRPVVENLLKRADLRRGERVLDVGAGPGLLSRLAADKVGPEGYVLGVDVAQGMIEVARQRGANLPQLAFERHDANAFALPDASFDAVISSFGLPFADPSRCLPEIYRVLRPEGRLAATLFGLNWGLSYELRDALATARAPYLPPEADEWAREIDHSRMRALARWALLAADVFEARMGQLGFRQAGYESVVQTFKFEGPRAVWDYHYAATGLRRFISDWPPEKQAAFHTEMAAIVTDVLGGKKVTQKWEVIYLTAKK